MSYKHLTIKEREILMFLRAKGLSIRAVALRLGRNPSTISRELKRCAGNYSPSKADNDYHQKRQNCHKKRLLDSHPQLRRQIVHYILDLHWSPEQITARFNKEHQWCVSYNTIYRHIYQHNLGEKYSSRGDTGIQRHLRHKHRTRHSKNTRRHREVQTDYISIHERPGFMHETLLPMDNHLLFLVYPVDLTYDKTKSVPSCILKVIKRRDLRLCH